MTPDFDIAGDPKKTRIVVGMSGGVDSSVAAALAKRAGYDVVGVTLQLYNHGEAIKKKGACCAGSDIHDARTVAAKIGIPHFVLDYEERFRDQVIRPFADSYARGETPVPCISCNQTVKFKDLLATAKDLGGAALVTGHYIQSRSAGNRRAMHRAHDADRDQSYFLYATTQEQLDFRLAVSPNRPYARSRKNSASWLRTSRTARTSVLSRRADTRPSSTA